MVGPGDGDRKEFAVFEPEGILLGGRAADDVDGNGDIDTETDVFGAENVAFFRSEMAFDLVVRKIIELNGGKFVAETFDDAGDGIVDGRMFADVGLEGQWRKRQELNGKIPAERTRHCGEDRELRRNYKAGRERARGHEFWVGRWKWE